jgi:DNA-binding transcriptional MerR regulator
VTIRELSNELGVSEQALRQWCKKNNVRKESTNETKGKQAAYFLDENTIKQIKDYYSGKGKETKASTKGKESNNVSFRSEMELLKQTVEALQQQLEVKDNQISELTEMLASSQEQQKALTALLNQQQALHAGDIQRQLTAQERASESVSETAEQESEPPKRSFFKSFADLFRRKGE